MRTVRRRPIKSIKNAFSKFNKKHSGKWRVRYNPRTAFPEALVGGKTQKYFGSPKAAAGEFLRDNESLLGVRAADLRLVLSKTARGVTHMMFEQTWNAIPVENATVKVHMNSSGEVISYQSRFEPDISVSQTPSIPEASARAAASSDLGKPINKKGTLVFFPFEKDGTVHLAWKIRSSVGGGTPGRWIYYVDAHSGDILFRYNTLKFATNGTVHGRVYPISPNPAGIGVSPVPMPMSNQYVWIGSYDPDKREETDENGDYATVENGKIFASLKGPYFSVSNFGGASAHYDNGTGEWRTQNTYVASPDPYSNNMGIEDAQTVTLIENWGAGEAFAKVMPRFSKFKVGNWNWDDGYWGYDLTDTDELHIINPGTRERAGSHLGSREIGFYGAAVEYPSYILNLKTNESGVYSGYEVDHSSYLVLTDSPGAKHPDGSSFMWTGTHTYVSYGDPLDEINAFYHLNELHDYLTKGVNKSGEVNLNWTLPVMVHALGEPDKFGLHGGYDNAFYDNEQDNIMFGDGYFDDRQYSYALDGTVVRHEYTHAVVNRIFPLIYWGESGAIDEAMADYWSLSSFSCLDVGDPVGCSVTNKLGNFLGGLGVRDISSSGCPTPSGNCHVMPDSWIGEVHDDSLMLSEALWELRSPDPVAGMGEYYLGMDVAGYAGLPRADVFVFNALFYFPDNFANFYDAMITVCAQLEGSGVACPPVTKNKIDAAFENHGISPSADIPSGDYYVYENNNGPEVAADISAINPVTAYLYPEADVDYYSIPLAPGTFRATISVPEGSNQGTYHAFMIDLFDAQRRHLAYAMPQLQPYWGGYCPPSGECLSIESSAVLQYEITTPGRYYLAVSPGLGEYGGYTKDYSDKPYSIQLEFDPSGSAEVEKVEAIFDNDIFEFSVPYTKFNYGSEVIFHHALLRDHSRNPLLATRTDNPNGYLELVGGTLKYVIVFSRDIIKGQVRLKPGFNARYPAVGTVHLEIFATTRMSSVTVTNTVVSLGISNPINLTTNKSDATMWNNIIAPGKGTSATVRWDLMSAGHLSIRLYTLDGALVKTLYDGNVPAGKGAVDWEGKNDLGSKVASGVYLVKIKGPGLSKIRKIVVIK